MSLKAKPVVKEWLTGGQKKKELQAQPLRHLAP